MSWLQATRDTINEVHRTIPADADEETCRKALSAAYPFGEREMSPYKTWCHNVQNYLILRFPNGKAAQQRTKRDAGRLERRLAEMPPPEPGAVQQEAMEL